MEELNVLPQFPQAQSYVAEGKQTQVFSPPAHMGMNSQTSWDCLASPWMGWCVFLLPGYFRNSLTQLLFQTASYLKIPWKGNLSQRAFYGTLIPKHVSRHYLNQCKTVVQENAGLRFVKYTSLQQCWLPPWIQMCIPLPSRNGWNKQQFLHVAILWLFL